MFDINATPPQNPFEVISLPATFDLDAEELRVAYIKSQQIFHPDRFVSSQDKKKASIWSEAANQAYKDLQNPITRAKILYQLLSGSEVNESSNDPALLELMMDLRESSDCAVKASKMLEACMVEISENFANQNYNYIPKIIHKMTYLNRLSQGGI